MDNKENYNLNDKNGIITTSTTSLSRSSSACSLFNVAVAAASSSATTSPSSPSSTSPSLSSSASSQKYISSSINQNYSSNAVAAPNSYFNYQPQQLIKQQDSNEIDWSVLHNAEKFLQRDDSIWINKLNRELWWNLNKLTDMVIYDNLKALCKNNMSAINQSASNANIRVPRKICGNSNMNSQSKIQQQVYNQSQLNMNSNAKLINQQLAIYQQQQQQQRMFNQNGRFYGNN